jgi:two-component system, cell cycle sensor histidine kinase and response regulator CckA
MKKRKPSILVVDDEAAVLFTYRILLEQHGYAVTAVLSARDAIHAINLRAFDLLLCDLSLEQGRTGFEVMEHARRSDPGVPCVLLTGYASVDSAQKAEQLCVAVLYKPIEIREFLDTISSALREAYEQTESGKRAPRSQAS